MKWDLATLMKQALDKNNYILKKAEENLTPEQMESAINLDPSENLTPEQMESAINLDPSSEERRFIVLDTEVIGEFSGDKQSRSDANRKFITQKIKDTGKVKTSELIYGEEYLDLYVSGTKIKNSEDSSLSPQERLSLSMVSIYKNEIVKASKISPNLHIIMTTLRSLPEGSVFLEGKIYLNGRVKSSYDIKFSNKGADLNRDGKINSINENAESVYQHFAEKLMEQI